MSLSHVVSVDGAEHSSEGEGEQEESEKELLASLSVVVMFFNHQFYRFEFGVDESLLVVGDGGEIGAFRDFIVMESLKLVSLDNHLLIIPEFIKLILYYL